MPQMPPECYACRAHLVKCEVCQSVVGRKPDPRYAGQWETPIASGSFDMIGYLALLIATMIGGYLWTSVRVWTMAGADPDLDGASAVLAATAASLVVCVLLVWPAIFACWLVGLAFGVLIGRLP